MGCWRIPGDGFSGWTTRCTAAYALGSRGRGNLIRGIASFSFPLPLSRVGLVLGEGDWLGVMRSILLIDAVISRWAFFAQYLHSQSLEVSPISHIAWGMNSFTERKRFLIGPINPMRWEGLNHSSLTHHGDIDRALVLLEDLCYDQKGDNRLENLVGHKMVQLQSTVRYWAVRRKGCHSFTR